MKENISQQNKFLSTEVFQSEIEKELTSLNIKKATIHKNIPQKVLKISVIVNCNCFSTKH